MQMNQVRRIWLEPSGDRVLIQNFGFLPPISISTKSIGQMERDEMVKQISSSEFYLA